MPGRDLVPVAVTISGRQLAQGDPLALVHHCLGQSGIQAGQIELELTESTLMNDTSLAARVLRDLTNMGIKVSLDDFGAGYSSLGYLKRFPLSTLKIDRSFVRDIETDDDDATFVKVIIALAGSFGIQVIAEGVENEHQVDFLRTHGCQQVQGFLFSRPLTAVDFAHLLRRGQGIAGHLTAGRTAPAVQSRHRRRSRNVSFLYNLATENRKPLLACNSTY